MELSYYALTWELRGSIVLNRADAYR